MVGFEFASGSIIYIFQIKHVLQMEMKYFVIQVIMNILTNAKDVLLSKGNDFRKLIFIEIYKENDKSIINHYKR